MAEDMYELGVQLTADRSPSAESKFISSVQQAAKGVKAEILLAAAGQSIESMKTEVQNALNNTTFQIQNIQLASSARTSMQQSAQALVEQMKLGAYGGTTNSGIDLVRNTSNNTRILRQFIEEGQKARTVLFSGIPEGFSTWNITPQLEKVTNGIAKGAKEMDSFKQFTKEVGTELKTVFSHINIDAGKFLGTIIGIRSSAQFMRKMIDTVIDLNDAMTQLKIVTHATDEEYQQYAHDMARTATEIGIATKDLIDASTVYARLGYTLQDSSSLAKYTGMLQNVGDIDASTAQSAITSIVKAFNIDISDIESVMDRLIAVGNAFPISVKEIAEGMMNASSSLHAAGNSLEGSIALLTAANTTTQDIKKASTAVRTIAARLRNTKAELDDLGEVVTEAKYQELVDMITGHGVSLVDEQTGDLRNTYDVLKDIAAIWKDIGINERAALATQIAGVRQQNVFYSILEQFQEAENAMEKMSNSAGTLEKAYDVYMDSVTAHINQLKAQFQALSQAAMSSDLLKFFIDLGSKVLQFATSLAKTGDELGIIKTGVLALGAAIVESGIVKIFNLLSSSAIGRSITAIKGLLIGGMKGDAMFAFAGGWGAVITGLTELALIIIPAVKAAYDKLNVTLDEHQARVRDTEGEIENIEEQLAGVRDRIAELKSMGPLTITEATELSRLEGENAVLEARLATQQAILAAQKEAARYKALGATGVDTQTADVIDEYRKAKKELSEAQDNIANNAETDPLFAQQRQQLDRLRKFRDEWDAMTRRQRTDTGYATIDELNAAITNLESVLEYDVETYTRDTLEKSGENVASAAEAIAEQIEDVQQLIDFLDPDKDASRIKELRLELVQLYDALGAKNAVGTAFGSMLNEDAQSVIDGFVSALNRGDGLNKTFDNIKNFWESSYIQDLVDEFAELGVVVDYSHFLSWILGMTNAAKATNEAREGVDKTTTSLSKMLEVARSQSDSLDKLKSAFDTIQEAAKNGTKIDWSSILGDAKFVETFGRLDGFEEFQRLLLTTPDDIEAVSKAFHEMSKEALLNSEAAKDWTSSTRATAEALLEQKGYIDATDLMRLAANQDAVARASDDQADATWQSVAALRDEAAAGSLDRQILAELAAQKALVNRTWISTSGDIDQLIALANAANATSASLVQLHNAQAMRAQTDTYVAKATQLAAAGQYEASQAAMKIALEGAKTADSMMQRVADTITFNRLSATDFYGLGPGNYNTTVGSGGGSSSAKNVEEYIADIDKYYAALKRLESAKLSMADANRRLEATEDYNEKIRVTKEIIDLYKVQSDAEAELIALRKQTIETESEGLRALGFEIAYNNKTNEFYVANLEHINNLTADSVGEYESLEEATNALRKETEGLINSLDSLNKENQEGVESLHDLSQNAKEARNSIVELYESIVKEANDVVDGFQNVYKVLTDAAKEYAQTGYLSVDSLQSILDLGPKYLAMLVDENGQLVINEQNLQAVIAAKTQDMAAETALSYAKQVLLATERGEEDVLRNLTDATAASSAATWDLAFATVGLAKAIGTANGMSEEYYDNAVSYLTSMQSLTETAVNSIPQYYETLKSSYISQADALDQVLKLTQDMLKWENQQAIDALNKQKDAYGDIINQKKELLKLTKEEQDHEKDLAEKIAEIAKLQARIDQLSLDDSREAQAQKRKLEEELAKLQKGLTDDQAGYALDVQNDALDKQLEMYENEKDDEIAALEDSLNSAEKLYQAALHELETNYGGTIERLKQWNYECGNTLQQSLLDAIDAATAALDRFGGSFTAALEGVDSYTNLGTNNTSGAATSASANDIISTMRRNSITWWTTPNVGIDELNAQQASLAKQYSQLSGDEIYKDANGTWHHANGDVLYSLSAAEKDQIAHNIVAKMKANSAAWFTVGDAQKQALSDETLELGKRFGWLTGKTPTRDANGTWWLDGKKLYDIYHSGGIVGRGSFKQNEVLALLEKGEAVLDDEKQKAMYKAVDFVSTLAQKIGSAVDVSRLFGGVSPATAGGAYASLFGRGAGVNGSLLGCNIERIDIVAPIQVVQKLDSEELKAHADMIGALSAQYIREGFTKRGVGTNVTAL